MYEKMKKLALMSGFAVMAGLFMSNLGPKNVGAYLSNPALNQLDEEQNAEYLIVYNEDNVAHEVGDVVVFVSTATNGIRGLSVSTTTTLGSGLIAGVVFGNDISATSWGKIQIRGYCPAVNITGNSAIGDALITSATGEVAVATTVPTDTVTRGIFGVALTAESDGTIPAFLR